MKQNPLVMGSREMWKMVLEQQWRFGDSCCHDWIDHKLALKTVETLAIVSQERCFRRDPFTLSPVVPRGHERTVVESSWSGSLVELNFERRWLPRLQRLYHQPNAGRFRH